MPITGLPWNTSALKPSDADIRPPGEVVVVGSAEPGLAAEKSAGHAGIVSAGREACRICHAKRRANPGKHQV